MMYIAVGEWTKDGKPESISLVMAISACGANPALIVGVRLLSCL